MGGEGGARVNAACWRACETRTSSRIVSSHNPLAARWLLRPVASSLLPPVTVGLFRLNFPRRPLQEVSFLFLFFFKSSLRQTGLRADRKRDTHIHKPRTKQKWFRSTGSPGTRSLQMDTRSAGHSVVYQRVAVEFIATAISDGSLPAEEGVGVPVSSLNCFPPLPPRVPTRSFSLAVLLPLEASRPPYGWGLQVRLFVCVFCSRKDTS